MSGPALRKVESHSSIHEAALEEARELTNVIENLLKENDTERALEATTIAIEHWETRTLAHADAEEKGLYKEMAEKSPKLKEDIIALTRDHNLMRNLVTEIKGLMNKGDMDEKVVHHLHALILVDEQHNKTEESILPEH
ncbi:hemerythrin domain-containing protein [Aquibacillus kalidii]|uniref:hemerythrin domain-containing protein n=1 Tax=Aquibacillus kalidii TaxID=2762597 RepID=UPI0016474031|nr:hemerythrin domain-containing protein [Aquibacillus kalidii]